MNNLLSSGWYHVTIRSAEKIDNFLEITFTVDRGNFAYRNIIEEFPLTERGLQRLSNLFEGLGYEIETDISSDMFTEQFTITKTRANARVDRQIQDSFVVNRIIELQLPEKPEDYNVLAPKTDEFFQEDNSGRTLPIQEEE